MAPAPGTRLGPYEILSPLGAGGMGEVYRARDGRLDRDVAIKVLPVALSFDQERLRRFEKEARSASALNHPNLVTIYDVGSDGGVSYIAMELVDGATLRQLLVNGPVPIKKLLQIAPQIAEGLARAHEAGIVHRDLKPENVMVKKDGLVKILDFGLAKLSSTGSGSGEGSQLPTMTGTQPGAVVGTVSYMSPEQASGATIDFRSDQFSLGSMLYEMATGNRAFQKKTAIDTLAAILNEEPETLTSIAPQTPTPLRWIAERCLAKEPEGRYASTRDLARDLSTLRDHLSETTSSGSLAAAAGKVAPLAQRLPFASRLAAGALACVLLGVLVTWLVLRSGRRSLAPTVAEVVRLTHDAGFSEWPSWSQDGSLLAFASNRSGNFEIYVRRVEGGQEVNITNDPAQNIQPAFSPNGNSIAFVSTRSSRTGMIKIGPYIGFDYRTYGGDVWVIPALGGRARRLAQDGNFPSWHPDGRKIAYVSGPEDHRSILEVPVEGGTQRPVLPSEKSTWEIVRLQYSPKGNWISFETWQQKVWLVPATGGTPRELLEGSSHVWDPSGRRLYYVTWDRQGGSRLQSVQIDEGTGMLLGSPRTADLMTGILKDLAIARDGQRLVVSERRHSMNLTRLRLVPGGGAPEGPEEELSSGEIRDRFPSFSPDGRRIAVASTRLGDQEVWIHELDSRQRERLRLPRTELGANLPYWSPNGHNLAVSRFFPDGRASLWSAAVDGSLAEELVSAKPELRGAPFSPDGRSVLYSYLKDRYHQMFLLDLASRQERQLTTSASDKYDGAWSPDGRWVIYSSNASGSVQIWRIPASGGEEKVLTSGYERMRHAFYSSDGRWIYVQPSHLNIYRMPAFSGPLQKVTNFPESGLFLEEPIISPDGRWLAYCRSNGGSSLWLLKIGGSQGQAP